MRRRFFVEGFSEGRAVLAGEAAHHLGRVLRAEPGQLYELSDGREVYLARLDQMGRGAAEFALVEKLDAATSLVSANLLIAIVKFDRFEWALEKATELGADKVVPLAAERSGKMFVVAAGKRAARWQKILLESAQQARRLSPPVLQPMTKPAHGFRAAAAPMRILLSENPEAPPLRAVLDEFSPNLPPGEERFRVALAIGPEGGWTEEEFESARRAGFREAALGSNILRTETAVIAGLAAVQLYFDRR